MKAVYLEEARLKFGQNVCALDPRIGLLKGGPFGHTGTEKTEFKIINCGVIGTSNSIARTKDFVKLISFGFGATDSVYGNLGFPGLGTRSPLQFSLRILPQWEAPILDREIHRLKCIKEKNLRKNSLIDLIEEKIQNIKAVDPNPHIIFVALSENITKLFQRNNIKSDKIIFADRNFPNTVYQSEGDINFHSIIKVLGMKYNIPTQLLRFSTISSGTKEDIVTTAWNFTVAQYYKADNLPWKFSELDNNVCYVGISFYRDFSQQEVSLSTSMAQVFLYTGESFILKGDTFEWKKSEEEKQPHLDEEKAKSIIDKVLAFYRKQKDTYPSRIVIYKTSGFVEEEIEGFYSNSGKIENIDMVTINPYPKIRVYRQGKYPVMRGTLIYTMNHSRCYLFTNGYLPALRTYAGMRTPIPLEIKQFTHNSDISRICAEILILTRLDWNNIKFCQRMPVTLKFSKLVGNILSERRASEINIQPQYRYYM